MKRTKRYAWLTTPVIGAAVLTGCSTTSHECQTSSSFQGFKLLQLQNHLTGSFSSLAQATEDPEFFDIVLHMVPIWEDRDDGPWLYVEQAVAQAEDQPYRQRVYQLAQTGGNEFVSTVYSFENPMDYAGAYTLDAPLSDLTPGDLTVREGCAITMSWDETHQAFIGSTNGRDCVSNLRGSTYATSEVFLHMERLITWDRGFDDNDEQVWGAVKGGYVFDRVQ
jgi:CpeT protein